MIGGPQPCPCVLPAPEGTLRCLDLFNSQPRWSIPNLVTNLTLVQNQSVTSDGALTIDGVISIPAVPLVDAPITAGQCATILPNSTLVLSSANLSSTGEQQINVIASGAQSLC